MASGADLEAGRSVARGWRGREVALPIVLSLVAVAIYAAPALTQKLEYRRSAILDGEVWRLLTGHWTHGSVDHLLWDVVAFGALGYVLAQRRPRLFRRTLLLAATTISAALLALPRWETYRGLSGIDSALFVALAIDLLRSAEARLERWIGGALLALFVLKLGVETLTGVALFASATPGHSLVPAAHLVGALTGALLALRN